MKESFETTAYLQDRFGASILYCLSFLRFDSPFCLAHLRSSSLPCVLLSRQSHTARQSHGKSTLLFLRLPSRPLFVFSRGSLTGDKRLFTAMSKLAEATFYGVSVSDGSLVSTLRFSYLSVQGCNLVASRNTLDPSFV